MLLKVLRHRTTKQTFGREIAMENSFGTWLLNGTSFVGILCILNFVAAKFL